MKEVQNRENINLFAYYIELHLIHYHNNYSLILTH